MKFYHRLKEDMVRVVVVDPGDHILPEFGISLGPIAFVPVADDIRGERDFFSDKLDQTCGHSRVQILN